MLFFPKMYKRDIHSIPYEKLYDKGIRLLIFDLDNTIGFLDQKEADNKTKKLFKNLQKKFHVAIVSNNSSKHRVSTFAKSLNCDFYHFSMKPSRRSIKKASEKFSCKNTEICVIGDQLVTDILAANRFGAYSCLVDAISEKDLKITSVNRFFEKNILKRYERDNIMKKGEYYE